MPKIPLYLDPAPARRTTLFSRFFGASREPGNTAATHVVGGERISGSASLGVATRQRPATGGWMGAVIAAYRAKRGLPTPRYAPIGQNTDQR